MKDDEDVFYGLCFMVVLVDRTSQAGHDPRWLTRVPSFICLGPRYIIRTMYVFSVLNDDTILSMEIRALAKSKPKAAFFEKTGGTKKMAR